MLRETEHTFAVRFGMFPYVYDSLFFNYTYTERGNRKKAINHLRVRPASKAHHFTAFRSGLWLGLGILATAGGCYLCMNILEIVS